MDEPDLSLGEVEPLEVPRGFVEGVDYGLVLVPIACSNFYARIGEVLNKFIISIFMIELVGMFGVSFSNPPCIYITDSMAHTECLNLYNELNFFHSELSVS